MAKFLAAALVIIIQIAITILLSLALSIIVELSWNYVMPYLFGFKIISWLQAWALCLIGSAIFKSNWTSKN